MGRSNTLPINQPYRQDNGHVKGVGRSATTNVQPSGPSSHGLKLPHLPFHHNHNASSQSTTSNSYRPSGPNRQNSVQTRYITMLLGLDTIPRLHNILSSFFTWILLAGFVVRIREALPFLFGNFLRDYCLLFSLGISAPETRLESNNSILLPEEGIANSPLTKRSFLEPSPHYKPSAATQKSPPPLPQPQSYIP
jgi:hypothetical protein